MAHLSSRDPAALLRGHLSSPARGENEQQWARVGRARLSQQMAVAPVNPGFAFNPALRLAGGLAAFVLIAATAFHFYQPQPLTKPLSERNPSQAVRVNPAQVSPAPVQVAAVSTPLSRPPLSELAPATAPAAAPAAARSHTLPVRHVRHSDTITQSPTTSTFVPSAPAQVVSPAPQAPGLTLDLASAPIPSLWGHEPSSELRLAKVSDGIRISWDGRHPSNHQFELTKTCVDMRHPGAVTTSTRIRLNTSEWVDDSKTGACGPGEAAQYEVAEVGTEIGHA